MLADASAGDPRAAGLGVARRHRVGVFCTARGEPEAALEPLRRIDAELRSALVSVCILLDAEALSAVPATADLDVIALAGDPGYGALQKAAFAHAQRIGLDLVVVLPLGVADAAAQLPALLAPFADASVAAVFGTRFAAPRRGAMSGLRRAGNRIVSAVQARLLRSALTDLHSGYRAYRTATLDRLPYRHNGEGLQFDTEVAIQLQWKGARIVEVPVPAHSGGRLRGLHAVRYGLQSIATVLRAKANRVYLVYHPKFDVDEHSEYVFKEAPTTVHQAVLRRTFVDGTSVLEMGAGHGGVARALHARGLPVVAVDHHRPDEAFPFPYLEHDLDHPFAEAVTRALGRQVDCVVALDVIEHLKRPEDGLQEIRAVLVPGGRLIASTGNIAFWAVRFMLLFGQFNYGKRGILDRTHTRLFSVRSFCRTIEGEGFRVRTVRGFGPPIEDMVGRAWPLRLLDRIAAGLAKLWPSMFAYQFLVEADVGPRVVVQPGTAAPRKT
ncbi:MAG: bifunctional glycosyltransferase/class I SAM-dependent methyltransferase [Planctomycetota bacterium]